MLKVTLFTSGIKELSEKSIFQIYESLQYFT